jgi:hypothetical protein
MKNYRTLMGMLAAALAFVVTLTGCEGPVGPSGPQGPAGGGAGAAEGTALLSADLSGLDALPAGTYYLYTAGVSNVDVEGTIPAGYTVNLYGAFAVDTDDLVVKGALAVGNGATLTTDTAKTLTIGDAAVNNGAGTVTVKAGGTLISGATSEILFAPATAGAAALSAHTNYEAGFAGNGQVLGGSSNAKLVFESGATYYPTTTAITITDTNLNAVANGPYLLNITSAATTGIANLTVRYGTTLTATGALEPTGTTTVNGALVIGTSLELAGTLNIGAQGNLILLANHAITLVDDNAKINAGTYNIVGESGTGDDTLTAENVSATAIAFNTASIEGFTPSTGAPLASVDATSAAALSIGVGDAVLTVTGDTTIAGVILNVAAYGVITVKEDKVLTLALGAGSEAKGSGGISTKTPVNSATTLVKASATGISSSGNLSDIAGVASSKIAINNGSVGSTAATVYAISSTAVAADGVIVGEAGDTTIDKDDTFAGSNADTSGNGYDGASVITVSGV